MWRRSAWPLLVGAWVLLVTTALFLRPLLPIDETRYASVAWEMWRRGDLLVPHLNGLPYSDKPPLLFWLFNLGWWVFGVNDGWPRIVPSLFALANLFLTAALARRLWPDRPAVARAAPWVLLGCLLWSVYTSMVMFDMLVAFCVLLALLGLEGARRRGGVLPWLQVGSALGLGILAKGPVVFLVPAGVALLAPWWGRDAGRWRGARGRRWALGFAGAVVLGATIALAWALPAARAGGSDYAQAILFSQTEERLVHSVSHRRPGWWYLALLPAMLFPYSLWPPLWKAVSRLRPRAADPGERLALAWLLPGLLVFSLISGKQPHYLLPLLPAFALLAARWLDGAAPEVRRWQRLPPLAGLLGIGLVVAGASFLAGRLDLPEWAASVSPATGYALIAAAVLLLWSGAGLPALTLTLVTALSIGFSEAAHQAYDLRPIARYLADLEKQGRPIAYVGEYHGEFHFLGRLERPFEEIPLGAERIWARQHPGGRVIQELRYLPADVDHTEFTQPYRGETLAVWGT
jgi:4-amino-4-deoxy-L-arabinose transferase-like glycosyltransferase